MKSSHSFFHEFTRRRRFYSRLNIITLLLLLSLYIPSHAKDKMFAVTVGGAGGWGHFSEPENISPLGYRTKDSYFRDFCVHTNIAFHFLSLKVKADWIKLEEKQRDIPRWCVSWMLGLNGNNEHLKAGLLFAQKAETELFPCGGIRLGAEQHYFSADLLTGSPLYSEGFIKAGFGEELSPHTSAWIGISLGPYAASWGPSLILTYKPNHPVLFRFGARVGLFGDPTEFNIFMDLKFVAKKIVC